MQRSGIWVRTVGRASLPCVILAAGTRMLHAQQAAPLPDAPSAVASTPPAPVPEAAAGDAVYAPAAVGADTTKVKLETYLVLTFGPRAVVSPAFTAAIRMARPPSGYPRDWKDGAEAFGRNYGESLGSKVALETGRYGTAILLHEDFRYRRSPTATGFGRLFHAIGYTFVDQSDSGQRRLAVANFVGAAAGGFTAAAILPDGYNSVGDGAKDSASRFGGLAFSNVAREYAPEISRAFRALHLPFPHLPVPEWYTKNLSVAQPARAAAAPPAPSPSAAPNGTAVPANPAPAEPPAPTPPPDF